MDQLYLIEVLVDKIIFSSSFETVPAKNEITISITFGGFASMEIKPDGLREVYTEHDPFKRELQIDSGKSFLFPSKAENLLKILKSSSLELRLYTDANELGRISIPWEWDFTDMADKSRFNPDGVCPIDSKKTFDVKNAETEEVIGTIELFRRLSCYGQNIQTQFQVIERKPIPGMTIPKQYLFKSAKAETTFQAQKIGKASKSSDVLPIAPLYNPSDPNWQPQAPLTPADMTAEKINEILCKNIDCPGVQKFKEFGLGPAATGKGLGTLYGPTDVPISYGLSQTYGNLDHYGPYGVYTRPKSIKEPFIPKEPVTCANTPGCNSCNCKSHKDTEQISSCRYNETINIESISSNTDYSQESACDCCCNNPLRLSGGSPVEDENKPPEPMEMCKDLMEDYDKVLNEYKKVLGPCGQPVCPYTPDTSVQDACKDKCKKIKENILLAVEEEPNGLVSACGTRNCPFSRQPESEVDKSFQEKQMRNACGSPNCPYGRMKLGTPTDENLIEMQLIDGPSLAKSCGAPKCPYSVKPTLPPLEPIHWDCPDPLPKGACKNPQCPLKPPELRYNIVPKGPCGNITCPYATPPYCGDKNCPFGPPQPCPYSKPCCPPPSYPSVPCGAPPSNNGTCGNPKCPANPPTCGDPSCPLNSPPLPCPAMPRCPPNPCTPLSCPAIPTCPFSPPPPCTPLPCIAMPTCPFAPSPCTPMPTCPFSPPPPCTHPACPFAEANSVECPFVTKSESQNKPCENPSCPYANLPDKSNNEICSNLECPFAQKKESPCFIPPSAGDRDTCENPDCPYAKQLSPPINEVCSNPDCPYLPKPVAPQNICENPYCPYATKKPSPCFIPEKSSVCSNPSCPYAQPAACDNSACPFIPPYTLEVSGTKVTVAYGVKGDFDDTSGEDTCNLKTCKAQGGDLECDECRPDNQSDECTCAASSVPTTSPTSADSPASASPPQSKESPPDALNNNELTIKDDKTVSQSEPVISKQVPNQVKRGSASERVISKDGNGKSKKKPRGKYVYNLGDLYPGVLIGHKECIVPGRNVPAKMGWLWNIHVPCVGLKPRIGWRPGAVGRTIARRIIAHRKSKGLKLLEPLTPKASKKKMKEKYSVYESDSDVTVAPKPTLLVKKREGCYYITMNPLKDPKTIDDNENPYMDCTPMQFKITKNKEKNEEIDKTCFCGEEEEEQSSDSELDIEFTPPAGIIRPERLKRKKNVAHTDTQYNVEDFTPKPPPKETKGKGGKGKGKEKGKGKGKGKGNEEKEKGGEKGKEKEKGGAKEKGKKK